MAKDEVAAKGGVSSKDKHENWGINCKKKGKNEWIIKKNGLINM